MTNQVNDNWYEDFFQGINCELWENAIPAEVTKQEVDFLLSELNVQKGQHILDVPCGFGRHAIEFSNQGLNVTAIDISETFMSGLNSKIQSEQLNITAITGDILVTEIKGKFSGAVCLGNSFGYFNMDKMKVFVGKVASALEPGAKFIINSGMIAESILPNLLKYAENRIYNVGDISMEVTNIYHVEDSYMVSNLLLTKAGKAEQHAFKHYVFTLAEVKRLLKLFGLSIISTYGSVQKEAYKLGDPQVYIVAKKD
ncbi:cyclopropane-fatty-acyl-phospholipid synthase family protein [Haliscomenobacter sp.]|uniref:SAM-dependent methyltransferase n=1 Tax=Haliscomenobacter sp. TaxID=2717303 RepID=UPI0035935342